MSLEGRERISSVQSIENILDASKNPMLHKRLASNLSSFVNMTNTLVGAGVLGLPYAFASTGFVLGPIFLGLAMLFAWIGLHLIACVAAKTGFPSTLYSASRPVNKYLPLVFDALVLLQLFGAACAYLIIIGDLMPEVFIQLGYGGFWVQRYVWVLIGFSFAAPFSVPHEIDFLKFTSAVCVLFIAYVAATVLVYALSDSPAGDPCDYQVLADDTQPCHGHSVVVEGITGLGVLKVLSFFIFGYCCHVSAFPIVSEVKKATVENMDRVWLASLLMCSLIYFTVAVCGYHTYGSSARSDILLNYPAKGAMTVARLMICFVVTFSFPLQANPARRSVMTMLHALLDDADEEPSVATIRLRYGLVTAIFLGVALLVGLTVDDLGEVIAVIGATGGTTIMFLVPGGLYLYHFPLNEEADSKDVKEHLLSSSNSSSPNLVVLDSPPEASGLHERLMPEYDREEDEGDYTEATTDGDVALRSLVKDMPIPKVTKFWRTVAWIQLTLGLILMPVTLVAIFI
jgi:amino acid permease